MSKRCDFPECKKKILSLVIDCSTCKKFYCSSHRLPENHECCRLEEIKKNAFQDNKNNLENCKIINNIAGII